MLSFFFPHTLEEETRLILMEKQHLYNLLTKICGFAVEKFRFRSFIASHLCHKIDLLFLSITATSSMIYIFFSNL